MLIVEVAETLLFFYWPKVEKKSSLGDPLPLKTTIKSLVWEVDGEMMLRRVRIEKLQNKGEILMDASKGENWEITE